MRIAPTTHEHGASGNVYTYEGDFDVGADEITWTAVVRQAGQQQRTFDGSIPLTSPAVEAMGEQAVRDAILNRIDTFGNEQRGTV
jgi:hypothetical protein